MSKETYLDLCDMMGNEPLEEEMPIDLEDFPELIQQCFHIYSLLQDEWEGMGGTYLGKNYTIIFSLFTLYKLDYEETLIVLATIQYIDSVRSNIIAEKQKASKKSPPPQ